MSKRQKILAVIIGAVVAIVAAALFIDNNIALSNNPPSTPQIMEDSQSFTVEDVELLESALSSSEKSEQAKALIPGLRDGEWSSGAVLPEGAKLTIQHDTFNVDEDGYAQVDAIISGSISVTFIVGLVLIDDQWLIYATEQRR